MTFNPRNLVLFVLLVGGALTTWLLARITAEAPAVVAREEPVPRGYYLQGATIHVSDDFGEPLYRMLAERVEQEADSENVVLDEVCVEYTPETGVLWDICAGRGFADADRDVLRLQRVRLVHAGNTDIGETIFETNEMQLDTRNFHAFSDHTVTMRRNRTELEATGFELVEEQGVRVAFLPVGDARLERQQDLALDDLGLATGPRELHVKIFAGDGGHQLDRDAHPGDDPDQEDRQEERVGIVTPGIRRQAACGD